MPAAGMDGGYVGVRATSFAAPLVAGLLVADLGSGRGRESSATALRVLSASARDWARGDVTTSMVRDGSNPI